MSLAEIHPVLSIATQQRLASANVVFFGHYGDVTHLAQLRGDPRQTLYRQAHAVAQALEGTDHQQQLQHLQQQVKRLQQHNQELHDQLQQAVVLDQQKQAQFAAVGQSEGVSLPVTQRLLRVFLQNRTPSVPQLGRWTHQAARRSTALLEVLDDFSRPRTQQAAGDEIFFGKKPCLMVVDQPSLCWQSGRLVAQRDGPEWAQELGHYPGLVQLTRDGGLALKKGLAVVNAQRHKHHQPAIADQEDHFHIFREGTRALQKMQHRAARLLTKAEETERKLTRQYQRTGSRRGLGGATVKAWKAAEEAMDEWSAAQGVWESLRGQLPLFTPQGGLNTRAQAEAAITAALPQLVGPAWSKVKRQLQHREVLTFLDRAQQGVQALPLPPEVCAAALRVEGLRRQPGVLSGAKASACALRAVLLAAQMVLCLSGAVGGEALAQVRAVLGQVWRASSLVEGINSVARMQQSRHRRMTQGLLDLKRLYWNCRAFRTGKRKKKSPYELLGVVLPTQDWWALLKLSPEELRQQLSAPKVAA